MLRHSAAHLLAEAVRRLYPGVKIAIGPPIENGFYYDFEFPERDPREEDLEQIEAEIHARAEGGPLVGARGDLRRGGQAALPRRRTSRTRPSSSTRAEGDISLPYTPTGQFTDLCRGPHLQDSKPIKAFKLTSLAGAYWRGNVKNKQLTRIYGTAFETKEELEAHLEHIEEAKKRDHRILGRDLGPQCSVPESVPVFPFGSQRVLQLEALRPTGEREARLHRVKLR